MGIGIEYLGPFWAKLLLMDFLGLSLSVLAIMGCGGIFGPMIVIIYNFLKITFPCIGFKIDCVHIMEAKCPMPILNFSNFIKELN